MRKRKNFLPTFLLGIIFWVILALLVLFIPPDTFGAMPAFFILTLLVIFFPASLVFANSRRGFLLAFGVVFFLILRLFGIGNVLNLLLLSGILLAIEYYLSR